MEQSKLHNLIETELYAATTASALEANLNLQVQNSHQLYDFAINRALFKNYQVNYDLLKIEAVTRVLTLALMQLPSTDFLALSYLIPTKVLNHVNIVSLHKLSDLLERGKYSEFWQNYVAVQDLFLEFTGFVPGIRYFILSNIRDTFQNIQKDLFQSQLGLDDTSIVAFCESNHFINKIEQDKVYFNLVDENQNLVKSVGETLKMDEGLLLTKCLTSRRTQIKN